MNWAAAGLAAARTSTARSSDLARPSARWRMGVFFLAEEDAGAADLLGRDHAQEVRQQPVHELEVGRQGRDLLLLAVEDFFRELLLVQGLPGAAVHEHELRG